MKKKMRRGLSVLLAAVFLVSTGLMLRQYLSDRQVDEAYETAQQLARAPGATVPTPAETEPEPSREPQLVWIPEQIGPDSYMEDLASMDLAPLREVNPDVVGWIQIPGTKIDYPFLQGEDNDYYLKTTWDYQSRAAGAIFLECMNSRDMTDFNTIVYGHNMNSGSMFASLRSYTSQAYWQEHPYVYLLTDAGVWRYEIFAAYRTPVDSHAYGLSFQKEETKDAFLAAALEDSQIDTGITPAVTDRILTLSTCSGAGYSNRWVVHARLKMVQVEQ